MGDPLLRVFVACDVANLWKSCREQFGTDARVDFEVLSRIVPSIFEGEGQQVDQRLVAYIVTNPDQKHQAFEDVLNTFGYEVRERFMRYEKGFGALRTDWDVGITIDAIDRAEEYDLFVLVSGDGDFTMLLDYLGEKKDKETMVVSFQHSLSALLHRSADRVYYFNNDIVYIQKGQHE